MLEVFVNDRLGTKLAVLMNDDDTVGELNMTVRFIATSFTDAFHVPYIRV